MGILHRHRSPQETNTVQNAGADANEKNGATVPQVRNDVEQPASSETDGSSRVSLEQLDEKEVNAHPDQVTAGAALGVQKAEAAALVWPRWAVYCTYAWIWLCFFMLALQSGMTSLFNLRAYSDFIASPLLTTASVTATVVGGVIKLPIAKLLNLWGRAEAFMFFLMVYELGMIILAASTGPSSYAAGYVLYWIGYDAIYLIMDIFVADTSGLRNRAFAFAFVGTPFICTAFTASLAAQSYLDHSTWRWGYGSFCIIIFFVFSPLAVVFWFFTNKAKKMGLYKREPSGRTTVQSVVHYFKEFDIIGCFLLMAAFLLFLLPFNMSSYSLYGYNTPQFIAMVVIGILLFPVFYIWERYCTQTHFVRWELLKNPTVAGACGLSAVLYFSFYCWDLWFQAFVMVVYNLDVAMAGYMGQIYNVGSTFWGVVFGVWIRYTRHFKWTAMFFGVPLMFLGAGLMIHFRSSEQNIGFLVMCQIFIAFAGGTLVISEDMAVMAASDRDGVPMLLSILGLCSSIGGAIGYAVTGAIYQSALPWALEQNLPDNAKANATAIFNTGYTVQVTYDLDDPIRIAINESWGYYEKQACIASTALLVLTIPCIAVWKNYNVDRKQNKGVMI